MAGSMKDALRRAGLAPPAPPPPKQHREELPDDETLPPLFEKPAPKSPPHFEPSRPAPKPTP